MHSHLIPLLESETAAPVPDAVAEAAATLEGKGVAAILFYGSGLWKEIAADTVLDFYVLCDDLEAYGLSRISRLAARLLPPNVYAWEAAGHPAKVAVMSLASFEREARGQGLTPHVWARFAQPCRLVYAKDAAARRRVIVALAEAVHQFERHARRVAGINPTPRQLWLAGFCATLGYELRSETTDRAEALYEAAPEAYLARTRQGEALPTRAGSILGAQRRGKAIHLIRLMKAAFTYHGGVDYLLWKIARHSGVHLKATPFQKRHPLIGGWGLLWRLYRKGGFR